GSNADAHMAQIFVDIHNKSSYNSDRGKQEIARRFPCAIASVFFRNDCKTTTGQKKKGGIFQMANYSDSSTYSTASGKDLPYVVLQVTLKEKFFGTGSGNLTDLENAINAQVAKGYRLHTISTTNGGSKGFGGGDRIQATLVFEKIGLCR
ncbi:MAG: hypothetical protein LUF91_08970, partial [Oscillospiraceae bacterium]|nr:hypothetical protein [Oscillospiraceae bacterium]